MKLSEREKLAINVIAEGAGLGRLSLIKAKRVKDGQEVTVVTVSGKHPKNGRWMTIPMAELIDTTVNPFDLYTPLAGQGITVGEPEAQLPPIDDDAEFLKQVGIVNDKFGAN